MNESQIQEAIKVADIVVGFSDYLHKVDYSLDKWMEELRAMMAVEDGFFTNPSMGLGELK